MLKVYNTLSQKKEIFKPRRGKKINLFVCGPTVYDLSHLGHARTYVAFDMIAKYLRKKGFDVFYLQNITDIDDKIIQRAKETKQKPEDLAKDFEQKYHQDMDALKIDSVTEYARATDYIKEIISQVQRLMEKGFAYPIAEDGIYYDISKFKNYGKLAKRTALQAEDAVSRIDQALEKKNKGDFCLWKFSPPAGGPGEPSWPSPWGKGRPGWHIEDTAITENFFGPQYDIHGGAQDLIFPHHEAEIAQMEAISGKTPFVKYWLHPGFLTVGGEKMAKSLGNFITIKDFLNRYTARELRFFILKSHYRSPIDYSEKAISQAKQELARIDEFVDKIKDLKLKIKDSKPKDKKLILEAEKEFEIAMEDDFNTPKAMAVLFELVNKGNALISQKKIAAGDAKNILKFLADADKFFGFIFEKTKKEIPDGVLKLAKERENFRKQGKWQEADEIRKKIQQLGYQIEDTKEGPKLKQP